MKGDCKGLKRLEMSEYHKNYESFQEMNAWIRQKDIQIEHIQKDLNIKSQHKPGI
jgi:hypothetical protein